MLIFFKVQTNLSCCCCSGVWSNMWNTRTSWPSKTEREPLIKTPGQSFSCIRAPQTQSNISTMKMCLKTTLDHLALLPTMMKSEHWNLLGRLYTNMHTHTHIPLPHRARDFPNTCWVAIKHFLDEGQSCTEQPFQLWIANLYPVSAKKEKKRKKKPQCTDKNRYSLSSSSLSPAPHN